MSYNAVFHITNPIFLRPRPVRPLGHLVSAYLSCTFPRARGFLQLCERPKVGALGAGVGAALLGLSKSLCQAGLSYRLDLLQCLRQKLEMDLHHCKEAPTQHLGGER